VLQKTTRVQTRGGYFVFAEKEEEVRRLAPDYQQLIADEAKKGF